VLFAILGALGSHLVQIFVFALAFFILHHTLKLGLIGGRFDDSFATYLYFSAETYTSLGFGDIFPAGDIRILAGVEALTGLLMISWSASFSYLEMRRYW
jgi:voltage-gated potassium channel Kch